MFAIQSHRDIWKQAETYNKKENIWRLYLTYCSALLSLFSFSDLSFASCRGLLNDTTLRWTWMTSAWLKDLKGRASLLPCKHRTGQRPWIFRNPHDHVITQVWQCRIAEAANACGLKASRVTRVFFYRMLAWKPQMSLAQTPCCSWCTGRKLPLTFLETKDRYAITHFMMCTAAMMPCNSWC